jgi:hypothetical protein
MMRPMGSTQESILACIVKHGSWHTSCGWVWDTHGNTKKVLRTLMRRGFVEVYERGAKFNGAEFDLYKPTTAGEDYVRK